MFAFTFLSYLTSKLPKLAIIPASLMLPLHLIFTGFSPLQKFMSRCFSHFPKMHVVLQLLRRIEFPLRVFSKSFFTIWKDTSICATTHRVWPLDLHAHSQIFIFIVDLFILIMIDIYVFGIVCPLLPHLGQIMLRLMALIPPPFPLAWL